MTIIKKIISDRVLIWFYNIERNPTSYFNLDSESDSNNDTYDTYDSYDDRDSYS